MLLNPAAINIGTYQHARLPRLPSSYLLAHCEIIEGLNTQNEILRRLPGAVFLKELTFTSFMLDVLTFYPGGNLYKSTLSGPPRKWPPNP